MYEDNKQKIIAELKKLKDGLGRWKFAERGKLDGLIEKISRANFYDVGNLASFYASSDEILKDMDSEVCEEILKILDSCFKIHLGQKSLKECTDIAGLIKLPRFENIQPRLHQLVEERITEHRLIANLIKRFEKVGEAVFSKMSAIREGQSLFLQDMEEKKKLSAASKEALQALMKKLPESITSSKQKIDVEMTTMKSARKDEMVETEEHYLNDQGMPQPYKYKRLERVEDHETRAKAGEELAGLFEQEVALSDAQRAKVGALKDKIKSLVKEKHSTSVQPTPAEYWSPNDAYRTVHKTETVPDYEAQTKLWAEIAGIYQPLFDKKVAQATEEMRATPDYKAEEQRLLDSIKDATLKPDEEQKEKKLRTEMGTIADMDKRVVETLGTLSSMQQGRPTYNEALIQKLNLECSSMEANLNIFNSLSPSLREEKASGGFANIPSSQPKPTPALSSSSSSSSSSSVAHEVRSTQPRSESVSSSSSSMVKPVANDIASSQPSPQSISSSSSPSNIGSAAKVVPFDEKHEETSVEVVPPTLDMKVTLEKVLKEKEVDPDLVMDGLVRLIGINKEIQAIIEQRAVEKNARRYEELLDQKLSLDPILNILKAELKELAADSDYRADIMEFIAQKDLPEDLVREVLDKITELLEKEAEDALAEEETYMVGSSSSSSSSKEGISESKNDKEESSNVASVLVAKSPLPSAEPDKAPSSFFGSLFNTKAEANAAKGNVQQGQGTELTVVSPAARAVQMTTWGSSDT